MKRILLFLTCVLTLFGVARAGNITEDFKGFPSSNPTSQTTSTSSTTGIKYTNYGCYLTGGYLMMASKTNKAASYISWSLDINCSQLQMKSSSGGSTNAVVTVYADDVAIKTGLKINATSTTFTVDIPAQYQKAGTVYKVSSTSTSYNTQFTSFTYIEAPSTGGGEPDPQVNSVTFEFTGVADAHKYVTAYSLTDEENPEVTFDSPSSTFNYPKGGTGLIFTASNGYELSITCTEASVGGQNYLISQDQGYMLQLWDGANGYTFTVNVIDPNAPTAPEGQISVKEALELINQGYTGQAEVKGIISQIDEVSPSYGNATYYIKDDLTDQDALYVYRGKWMNGANFTSTEQIAVGGTIVVSGEITLYNGTTPEFLTGNIVLDYTAPTGTDPDPTDPDTPDIPTETNVLTINIDKETLGNTSSSYVSNEWEFETSNVTFGVNNLNPSSGQARGNQSSNSANFYLYNKKAIPGIIEVRVTLKSASSTIKDASATAVSLDKSIITSTTLGNVKGVQDGQIITYKADNSDNSFFKLQFANNSTSGTCTLEKIEILTKKVEPKEYTALAEYDNDEIEFDLGESYQLNLGEEHPEITWSFDPEDIISINENGLITATEADEVFVTATWGDDVWKDGGVNFIVNVNKVVIPAPTTITFDPEAGTITQGTAITITTDGKLATLEYAIDSEDSYTEYTGEGIILDLGTHTLYAKATNESGSVSASAVYVVEMPKSTTVVMNNQDLAYGASAKTKTWKSSDGIYEFKTEASLGSGKTTYPTKNGSNLRIYNSNENVIVVRAPKGYYFIEASATLATAANHIAIDGKELGNNETYSFKEYNTKFELTSVKSNSNNNTDISSMTFELGKFPDVYVAPGDNKTVQSGSVNHDDLTIKMYSQMDKLIVFIYSPEGTTPWYAFENVISTGVNSTDSQPGNGPELMVRPRRVADSDYKEAQIYTNPDYPDYENNGDYCVVLDNNTTGTLHIIYKNQNGETLSAEPTTYNFEVVRTDPTGVETVVVGEGEVIYFDLNGRRVLNPDKGIFIKVEAGKVSKVIL